MNQIRKLFKAPVFEDDEKNRSAYLLNFVTIAFFLISVSVILATFLASTDLQQTLRAIIIRSMPVMAVLVITQVLMRTGKVRMASFLLGILLWLATAFNVLISGGATSSAKFIFIVVVMIFGLLSGSMNAVFSALASILMVIFTFILENQGLLPPAIINSSDTTDIFTFFGVVFLTTSLLYLYRSSMDETVENLSQANKALEKAGAQLEKQVYERTRALVTSTEVSRRLSTILDQDQLVREVVEQLRSAFNYYHVHIYLFDDFKQDLLMAGGTGNAGRVMLARRHKLARGQGLVGSAAERNQPILISDVSKADGWLPNPLLPDTKAELAVPIAIADNVLGVLDVQHHVTNGLTRQDVDLIQAIANQVAIAVQNAQAYARSQHQAIREAQLTAINQRIQSALTIDEVLQIAVSELGQALGVDHSSVELVNPDLQFNLD